MRIHYTKQSLRVLREYDKSTRIRIQRKINGLTKIPPEGDIKPLKGSKNESRLRIGKYRVIFEYLTESKVRILMINRIDSRGDVYK